MVTRAYFLLALLLAAGCGRQRQPNVPAGEERVFRRRAPAEAATGVVPAPREDEIVSTAEAVRRAKVRQLEKLFVDAKSADDRLDALDKVLQQGIRAPELVPYVARCLSDPDPDQRIYGIKARAAISPGDALPDMKLVLRDQEPKVRQAAVESFSALPDPIPFDALFAHLESETDPFVQQAVMLVVSSRAPESEVGRTIDAIRNVDVRAVAPVIDFARKYPGAARPKADLLAYFLDRNDADLRMQVARLLGEWSVRTPAVVSGLVRALGDREPGVRKAAFAALRGLSNQDFGYDPDGTEESREKAIAQWRAWSKDGAPASQPAESR
jgi:hypothetical protein